MGLSLSRTRLHLEQCHPRINQIYRIVSDGPLPRRRPAQPRELASPSAKSTGRIKTEKRGQGRRREERGGEEEEDKEALIGRRGQEFFFFPLPLQGAVNDITLPPTSRVPHSLIVQLVYSKDIVNMQPA